MAAYVTQNEVMTLWKTCLEAMIRECRTQKKIPAGLVELIKHNLFARYVSYDATLETVEIGVNESKHRTPTYPTIKVYRFPLNEVGERLLANYEPQKRDLEFYARIFKGAKLNKRMMLI